MQEVRRVGEIPSYDELESQADSDHHTGEFF